MMRQRAVDKEAEYAEFREAAERHGIYPAFVRNEKELRAFFVLLQQRRSSLPSDLAMFRLMGNRMCAISKANVPSGTGFLVSIDQVLTADHILGNLPTQIACSFNNISFSGNTVTLDPPTSVDASVEKRSHAENLTVTPGHLDFALLKLAQPIGAEPRGFIHLDDTIGLRSGDKLRLMSHPNGGAVPDETFGNVVSANFDQKTSLVFDHDLDAVPGSSGGPIFNKHFELVGLNRAPSGTAAPAVFIPQIMKLL